MGGGRLEVHHNSPRLVSAQARYSNHGGSDGMGQVRDKSYFRGYLCAGLHSRSSDCGRCSLPFYKSKVKKRGGWRKLGLERSASSCQAWTIPVSLSRKREREAQTTRVQEDQRQYLVSFPWCIVYYSPTLPRCLSSVGQGFGLGPKGDKRTLLL